MNPEDTALADRAVHTDATPVHLGDVFDDGEAQSGTSHLPTPVFVYPVKSLEQTGEVFLCDAPSLINHGYHYLTVTDRYFDTNLRRGKAVLDGVVYEIDNRLFE